MDSHSRSSSMPRTSSHVVVWPIASRSRCWWMSKASSPLRRVSRSAIHSPTGVSPAHCSTLLLLGRTSSTPCNRYACTCMIHVWVAWRSSVHPQHHRSRPPSSLLAIARHHRLLLRRLGWVPGHLTVYLRLLCLPRRFLCVVVIEAAADGLALQRGCGVSCRGERDVRVHLAAAAPR